MGQVFYHTDHPFHSKVANLLARGDGPRDALIVAEISHEHSEIVNSSLRFL